VPSSPPETLANLHVLQAKFVSGESVDDVIFPDKSAQQAGFSGDSCNVVEHTLGKDSYYYSATNLREDKVTNVTHHEHFLGHLSKNKRHANHKSPNVPTLHLYTTNPIGIAQKFRTLDNNAASVQDIIAQRIKSSQVKKNVVIDVYPKMNIAQVRNIKRLMGKATPDDVLARRKRFIEHGLGVTTSKVELHSKKVSLAFKFNNVTVPRNATKQHPTVTFGAALRSVFKRFGRPKRS
jgi:hypothetical protein